ncbi:GARP complex subunit [Aspergillus luchuensis]|uniref:GARP complex subunit n=1 Tax=Aspergillus kawachii TaxID=1069201 RepID=A0A146F996_ASPKA|nr:GARP complex subunit [Aspergillus luchuensis]
MGPAKKGRPKTSANPSGPLHTVSPNRSNPSIAMTQMGGEAIRSSDSLPRPEGSGQRADHMEIKDFKEKTGKRQLGL